MLQIGKEKIALKKLGKLQVNDMLHYFAWYGGLILVYNYLDKIYHQS